MVRMRLLHVSSLTCVFHQAILLPEYKKKQRNTKGRIYGWQSITLSASEQHEIERISQKNFFFGETLN
jgi:hypothetical protein